MKLRLLLFALGGMAALTAAHITLNVGWDRLRHDTAVMLGSERKTLKVGFLPVTCHLTCPVTHWVTDHSATGSIFESKKFSDFPSMKEALVAREIEATFMVAPLAMKLVADGVPVRILYLGHRDGTELMVHVDSNIQDFSGLRDKKLAIPSKFSNQNLLVHRMMKQWGMKPGDIELLELPPPDQPAALYDGSIDAYMVGEPFPAKAEMGGWGRVLYYAKDIWPGFISCVLVVRQELIAEQRPLVQELVDGIAASGEWLDESPEHRMDAAEVVGRYFYNQDPELLKFVLSKPPDRVKYTNLKPIRANFDEIMQLANETGVIARRMEFEEYVDDSFAPDLFKVDVPFDRLPMEPVVRDDPAPR
jgi:NitT/TauT family transport system substrate-binding protein